MGDGLIVRRGGIGGAGKSEGMHVWKKCVPKYGSTNVTYTQYNITPVDSGKKVFEFAVAQSNSYLRNLTNYVEFFAGMTISVDYSTSYTLIAMLGELHLYLGGTDKGIVTYDPAKCRMTFPIALSYSTTYLYLNYNSTETKTAKYTEAGETLGFVLGADEAAFPNREEVDGVWYEKMPNDDFTVDFGTFTLSNHGSFSVKHNLGRKPLFAAATLISEYNFSQYSDNSVGERKYVHLSTVNSYCTYHHSYSGSDSPYNRGKQLTVTDSTVSFTQVTDDNGYAWQACKGTWFWFVIL